MLEITVRPANEDERLNVDVEAELPQDIVTFDGSDWQAHFFNGLSPGDWVVEIKDPEDILEWTLPGLFWVQKDEDGGFYRRIPCQKS